MEDAIRVKDLKKSYGNRVIFNEFNCAFPYGVYSCVVGPSGIGKTTLLRIIMGLEDYRGEITGIDGKKFSCVFQEDRLLEKFTGVENIKAVLNKNMTDREIIRELAKVGLETFAYKPVFSYSGGMKRRLSIVRALCVDFDIMVLDEPFKELDEEIYRMCIDYFEKKTRSKTVIMTTHNPREVEKFGHNLVSLSTRLHLSY